MSSQAILAAEQRDRVVSKLHSILKPFVLRRLKSDVEIALPRKMEVIMYAHMTDTQKHLNKQLASGKLMVGGSGGGGARPAWERWYSRLLRSGLQPSSSKLHVVLCHKFCIGGCPDT